MTDEVAEKLIGSIIALTKELKRHNDSHARPRVRIRRPEPAEYFTGAHSPEEINYRETRERLSQLRASDEEPIVEVNLNPRQKGKVSPQTRGD